MTQVIQTALEIEDKAIGDIKNQFLRSDVNEQRKVNFSVSKITGAISLAYYRGIETCKQGYQIINFPEIKIDENLSLVQSRNIYDFKNVMVLNEDLGDAFHYAIMVWCLLIKDKQDEEDQYKYWQLWLIKKDNVVIGICGLYSLYPHATDELWLSWFGIIPEFRSTGIGGIVLEWLKTKAKILGCNRLMSYVDKKGYPLEFYYRHKFSIVASTKEYLRSHPELSADSFGSGNDHIIGTAL